MNIKEVHNHLRIHGIKPSMQRVSIMQYLLENRTHPTIDQIFTDLLPIIPTLSKTTVYNTLKLFYEQNAVLALTIDEKNIRYDGYTSDHAHLKCKKCGMIYDIPLEKSVLTPLAQTGDNYTIEETQIYFLGVCKKCNVEN